MTNNVKRKIQPKICPPTNDFMMGVALVLAASCKDPTGQQAAVVVDNKERIIAYGVNILVQADSYQSHKLEWDAVGRSLGLFTATEAAVDRALKSYTPGSIHTEPFLHHTLYLTGPPFLRDVRKCAAHGLKTIIYGNIIPQYFDEQRWKETECFADMQNIKLSAYTGNIGWLQDRMASISHLF